MDRISLLVEKAVRERFALREDALIHLCSFLLEALGLSQHLLDLQLLSQKSMRLLNQELRGKDRSTDVLSFPQSLWSPPLSLENPHGSPPPKKTDPPQVLGDLVLCPEKALENAISLGHSLDRELCFLLIHGILHLCGHDHQEAEEEAFMTAQQRRLLELLQPPPPSQALWHDILKPLPHPRPGA